MGKVERKWLKATDGTKEQSWGSAALLQCPAIAPHLILQITEATIQTPCPVGLPALPFLFWLSRELSPPTFPFLDSSAIWQGLRGASQAAPWPGQRPVPGHPHSCSLPRDNQNSTGGCSTVGGASPGTLNFSGGLSQLQHYLTEIQEWT